MISIDENIHLLDSKVPILEDLELFMSNSAFLWGKSAFTTALVTEGGISFYNDHFNRILNTSKWLWGEEALEDVVELWELSLKELSSLLTPSLINKNWKLRFTLFEDSSKKIHSLLSLYPFKVQEVNKCAPVFLKTELIPVVYRNRAQDIKLGSYVDTFRAQGESEYLKLFFNDDGDVLETATSNIFFYNRLSDTFTYPYKEGEMLLGIGIQKGLNNLFAQRKNIKVKELGNYSHAFLINSLRGVQPVINLDGRTLEVNSALNSRVSELFNKNLKQTLRIL